MRLLRKISSRAERGYSVIMWAVAFSVMVAAFMFIRMPVKRALQGKVNNMADYMFWTKWGHSASQYKGDDTGHTKTNTATRSTVELADRRGFVTSVAGVSISEDTATSGVNEGDQDALKSVDLNSILP